jgi:hypothetical protein
MALSDITSCWRTSDGKVFSNIEDAKEHQSEIDLFEINTALSDAVKEALAPLNNLLQTQYIKQK